MKIFALAAGAIAAALALASFFSFRAALSAKIDRAASLESAVVRPAAAARLAAALAVHRLARVSESESRAVSGAFRSAEGDAALEGYRKAGGSVALLEEATKALAAEGTDAAADIAFLRAIRGLRAEAAETPVPPRPELPSSADRAATFLLAAAAAFLAAGFLAYAAGRSRAP